MTETPKSKKPCVNTHTNLKSSQELKTTCAEHVKFTSHLGAPTASKPTTPHQNYLPNFANFLIFDRICDNCIEHFDHHCSFLGTCIGRFNYKYFIGFLCSICLFMIAETAGFLIWIVHLIGSKNDLVNPLGKNF
jgi:hypothetical protein